MEYKKFVWLAWYAYSQNDLAQMTKYLERSLDYTPLSKVDTVLHWIQSFAQLSTSLSQELDYNSLIQADEWQQVIQKLALREFSPKSFGLATEAQEKGLLDNYKNSINKSKQRKSQQKYQQILASFSKEFQTKKRVLCLMLQMSEEQIVEAIVALKSEIKEKDILVIVITDYVDLKLFNEEQIIVEYFPLDNYKINDLTPEIWNKYFSNRVASLFCEWSPQAILDLKNSVQRNLLIHI